MDNNNEMLEALGEMLEEDDGIIVLNDEDGNEVSFEFLDLIEYNGEEYAVLLPVEDENGEVVILHVESINEEEDAFEGVESEEILEAVFEIFKEKFKDEFDFAE